MYLGRVTLFANKASLKLQWTAMAVWLTAVIFQVWEKFDVIVSVTSSCTCGLTILSVRERKRNNDLPAAELSDLVWWPLWPQLFEPHGDCDCDCDDDGR